ncbi:MAG: hypothetical protein V7K69_25825 [Nostoc sp.]|uniref:hypothetical protein n=1 Tax=Nostoc sp. TaxID=1180 RepID=UPI002FFBB6C7
MKDEVVIPIRFKHFIFSLRSLRLGGSLFIEPPRAPRTPRKKSFKEFLHNTQISQPVATSEVAQSK